jgi:hypothetical protein
MERKTRKKATRESPPGHGQIQSGRLNDNNAHLLAGAIFLVHLLALVSIFDPWTAPFSSEPIIHQDWGLHFHHLTSFAAFWRQDRMVWGYNPFFMAGYPSNTIQDLSIKFFEFIAITLSLFVLSPIQWLKISAFLATASVPWMMYFAARNFFIADKSKHLMALAAMVLGTVYWWNSLPREMFFYGMIGFPIASYLSVLGVSLFYRLAANPEKIGVTHIAWLLFAAAIVPLHVQSVATFLPAITVLVILGRARFVNTRLFVWTAAAVLLSFLANSVWLIPAMNHLTDDISETIVEQLPIFASANPFVFLLDYFSAAGFWTFRPSFIEKGFRIALLLLGALGIYRLTQSKPRDLGFMLTSAAVVLFVITYFGALLPFVKSWQPLRFKVPLDLFLIVGAAYSAGHWLNTRRTARSRVIPITLGCGLAAFVINLVQTEATGKLQLRTQLNPQVSAVIDWIERESPAGARVLFEESGDETGFVYDGAYLSSFLPHRTGRQLIGGPINLYNDRHHYAEFHSGKLFKKDVASILDEELRNYLRLYNIGAVVAFHPASVRRLLSIPGLVTVDQRLGPVHLMKVNEPLTWFISGEGKVKAGFNRLELSDLKGDEVILKYHWIEGLTASPPARIERVKMADDPIPFIKLVQPPARVVLRVGPSN